MPDWRQQWLNQNAPWLYPLAVVMTVLGRTKPTDEKLSFKMKLAQTEVPQKPAEVVETIKIVNPDRLAGGVDRYRLTAF
jgi:hypothetical protein